MSRHVVWSGPEPDEGFSSLNILSSTHHHKNYIAQIALFEFDQAIVPVLFYDFLTRIALVVILGIIGLPGAAIRPRAVTVSYNA
jgi:hypothetical protein